VPHTLVTFHAHPDDEAIATAGVMAKAASEGNRVVLVVATRGEHAGFGHDLLAEGEDISQRRVDETNRSAEILGVSRVEFLGYVDSGMMGDPTNDAPYCFWQASVEHAARRLAVILDEEEPDVLTIYDDNGGYGHPDHVQVHRVGRRAGELVGVPVIAQSTINRDWVARGARGSGAADLELPPDVQRMGKPEAEITHRVQAVDFVEQKRNAMRAHASQIAPDHFLLTMPDPMFAMGMGVEFYIVESAPAGAAAPELFEELFTPMR
jgi:LmbE family N-acetylglucosaminyl deacetylase